MRTTIDLDDDVSAAVEQLRQHERLGLSDAVNQLIRRGLTGNVARRRFTQGTAQLGLRVDVTNVAETLELLDEAER